MWFLLILIMLIYATGAVLMKDMPPTDIPKVISYLIAIFWPVVVLVAFIIILYNEIKKHRRRK